MSGPYKVIVLLESAHEYGRGLMRGITRYARLHGPWSLYLPPWGADTQLPHARQWGASGVIARISSPAVVRAIRQWKLPAIVLEASFDEFASANRRMKLCEIRADSVAVARAAADHLLQRGFRQFAYCGLPSCPWSDIRSRAFAEFFAQHNLPCHVYPLHPGRTWEKEQEILARWLAELPKPVGLMACNDDRGRQVLLAGAAAGVQLPEELAVVGVDNDELLCDLSYPPLSSVAMNLDEAGYQAAELLEGLMSGQRQGHHIVTVQPQWVVARRSTDVFAVEDRQIAAAIRFIRDHSNRLIGVGDVVEQTTLSRRTLERRFIRIVGHTVLDELVRSRVHRAEQLLSETQLPMYRVAMAAGFTNLKSLVRAFRQVRKCTPMEFRRREKPRDR